MAIRQIPAACSSFSHGVRYVDVLFVLVPHIFIDVNTLWKDNKAHVYTSSIERSNVELYYPQESTKASSSTARSGNAREYD